MTLIAKFCSDVQKLLKHERQNNSGIVKFDKIEKDLRKLFLNSSSCPGDLPGSFFEYWVNTYISGSTEEEPTQEHIQKLAALLSFLENTNEDEELITQEDWEQIGQLVKYEAEDLPIETLTALMTILVSKGAY